MLFDIYNVVIEVTRRCNVNCRHCLRGGQQNIDIKKKYIDSFFSKISYISILTITGGEPSLVPELINYIIESSIKHNTAIGNFYIATNAKKISIDFISSLLKLYSICEENETSAVHWSNDIYHDYDLDIELLEGLSFSGPKYIDIYKNYRPFYEGNAKENFSQNKCDTSKRNEHYDYHYDDLDEILYIDDGIVYLNAKGMIIKGCDFSYKTQDDKEKQICHVNSFNANTFIKEAKDANSEIMV